MNSVDRVGVVVLDPTIISRVLLGPSLGCLS